MTTSSILLLWKVDKLFLYWSLYCLWSLLQRIVFLQENKWILLLLFSCSVTSYSLHPLWSPSPAFSLSQHQGLFLGVGASHQMAKVLELQLQHQSFQCVFNIDFFKIDWFDHLAVQGTFKSLLQHHSSKASTLWPLPSVLSSSHNPTWLLERP